MTAERPIPPYLLEKYWWAYVHPRAVRTFERGWLVNAILFGQYRRLCDAALEALGPEPLSGRTLQMACVYGSLTARLRGKLAPDGQLEVADVLPIQLLNLERKLPADDRVTLTLADTSCLGGRSARYDQALLFFLLHEQPDSVRRKTLAEAMRVLRPGGRLVIVDYHRPVPWHPVRLLIGCILRLLEPFAIDLWRDEIEHFLPDGKNVAVVRRRTFFGGLYQLVVLEAQRPPKAGTEITHP